MFNKIKNSLIWKDNEFNQAVIRMLIGIAIIVHIGTGMTTNYYPPRFEEYRIFAVAFSLYTIIALLTTIFFQGIWYRRYITTTLDIMSICYSMLLTDAGPFSAYFLIYPWMFISNAVRYGKVSLVYTTVIAVISFIFVLLVTDTWYSHYLDAIAYLIFLLVLPAYINIMLKREMEEREEKERILKARNEFLATMSHEIRTPMSGIIGMTTLLDRTDLNKQQLEYIASLRESSSALHSLINSVLDLSKLEAKKSRLDLQPAYLQDVVESALQVFVPRAKAKYIKLDYSITNVPDVVIIDSNRLRQILLNLISNAIKFTHVGSVVLNIKGEQRAKDWLVRFEITDTGSGISKEHLKRIFEPFYQGDSASNLHAQGTGLGTTICKELVELMDGEIGAISSQMQGTTFWFELPLIEADPDADVEDSNLSARYRNTPQKLRILVAEDNAINAKVITTFLRDEGHDVVHVIDGEQALHELSASKFDMVFMDMRMPGVNGLAATEQWRRMETDGQHIPIIALTANASPEDRRQCLAAGMDDFLIKPVTSEELVRVIKQYY